MTDLLSRVPTPLPVDLQHEHNRRMRLSNDAAREVEAAALQCSSYMMTGIEHGRIYTLAELEQVFVVFGHVAVPYVTDGHTPTDREREWVQRHLTKESERLIERLIARTLLERTEDGGYRRTTTTTKVGIYVDGAMVHVDPIDAPAIIAAERVRLKALSPEAKAAARLDVVEAEAAELRRQLNLPA